jgi:hypothetical protein
MLAVRAELDAVISDAVHAQRDVYGRSWADIARAAGITRQSAYERWGRRNARTEQSSPQNGTEDRSGIEQLQELLSLEG